MFFLLSLPQEGEVVSTSKWKLNFPLKVILQCGLNTMWTHSCINSQEPVQEVPKITKNIDAGARSTSRFRSVIFHCDFYHVKRMVVNLKC